MARDLESRRQAIAAALRAVMSEPADPPPAPAPAAATPTGSDEVRPELPSLRASLQAQIDWDEVDELPADDADGDSPPIPPLELAGAMSRTASMALFGHA
ncbi:MAG: hypothetical protein JO246_06485 [Frankiaceae bacterium]|nr:hypothetical protein [Frankiaceae bacterium]MBV9872101.1 hypothetical protein [Frankiaceae bacterium]